jgi:rod shape-determining protein MreC
MALLDTRSRSGYLFLAVAVGHIILISAQVTARSGVPLLQAVVFGAFAEVQRATTGGVRAVRGVWDGYFALHGTYEQNEALKRENAYLRVKLQQTRALALESQSLRQVLDLRDRANLPTRAAEIIGTSATADFRTVTIDRGTADGIHVDMAVIAAAGAVGRVILPSRHASKVQLLVDRNAAAAVKVERTGAQGIVMGSGESLLRLEYLSTTSDLKVGDDVVTSGIDGVYPPGFAVGRVETIDRAGGTFRAVRVRPAVRLDTHGGFGSGGAPRGALLLALAIAVAVPGAPRADGERPLRFVGNRNIPPVVYLDGEDPTGVAVDLLGSRRSRRPHPAVVLLTGIARGVDDTLLTARRRPRSQDEVERMHARYRLFRTLLALNNEVLENLGELEEESSWTSFRHPRVRMGIRALFDGTADMVGVLNELTSNRYFDLTNVVATLRSDVFKFLEQASEREHAPLALAQARIRGESAAQVGDKALALARVECDVGLRVPDGFVATVAAYRELMDAGGLAGQLRTILAPARLDAPEEFRRRCELARDLVREAAVPPAVGRAIADAARECGFAEGEALAVRSSAVGEGSTLSFAGQFESFLNVPVAGLAEAWKGVVASRYSPRAVFYRRAAGLADVDTPMAVLVQRMVPARASGVLFTRRPDEPKGQVLLVSAALGLGPDVSIGIASADELVVSRAAPHRVLERRISPKRECTGVGHGIR